MKDRSIYYEILRDLMHGEKTRQQLKAFRDSLVRYSRKEHKIPADWFEAFAKLRELLETEPVTCDPLSRKMVVFLDEVPWMDTARSDFKILAPPLRGE